MAVITISLLTACSTSEHTVDKIDNTATEQAWKMDAVSDQAVVHAHKTLAKAKRDGLSYYTPLHFIKAQKSLEKIEFLDQKGLALEGEDINVAVMSQVFKTQELINEGYQVKDMITSTLVESLSYKKVLDELNCEKELPDFYLTINNSLTELFKLIEKNKIKEARQDEFDLLSEMIKAEIKTLTKVYITPASQILDKAKSYDADDYAENTFKHAKLVIKQAKEFIKDNYRKRDEVQQVASKALIAAKKALNTGKLSRSMLELGENEAELKALEMQGLLETVIQGFSAQNLEGLTLEEQAQALAELARTQAQQIKELSQLSSTIVD